MEAALPIAVFLIYGLIGIAVVVILIFLVVKRIEDKKNETFEDRDN